MTSNEAAREHIANAIIHASRATLQPRLDPQGKRVPRELAACTISSFQALLLVNPEKAGEVLEQLNDIFNNPDPTLGGAA